MALSLQKHNVEKLFIYFLLLQPALDVLAYVNIPLSSVLRGLLVGAGIGYIFFFLPDKQGRKSALIYLVILGIFMTMHLVNNYMVKESFSIPVELTYIIKTVFFIVMLLVYVFVIPSFSKQKYWQKVIQSAVLINMTFIAVIMLLATVTGSGYRSYGALAKEGHSGWFFSGNELSVILGMGFSITILYMLQKQSTRTKMLLLPVIGLIIWAMLMIGTKVSFGSVLIVLGISISVFILKAIHNSKNWFNLGVLTVLLAAAIAIAPITPIGNNLDLTFGTNIAKQEKSPADVDADGKKQAAQQLLSGRKDFLKEKNKQYQEAPVSQKLLGMGFGGNYTFAPKLIEMDFLDWYFNFGWIGFILLLLPLLYIGYRILIKLCKYHLKSLNVPIILTGVSVALGIGSAFTAGHVLSSPAASIYLAVFIGYLFALVQNEASP
ncbi:MAG TPA: O-antigen ligase family protein [Lentibacillus sp.]|uniref:O-antigen ligase family protein n=1 Tax=Lentibacillus sp. TaxID=1925746 RepID=UPI002B4B1C5D|nr:O-antigen ligase family protein [Lentibacillus sp.]HLR62795.1 O-antigen ligase family protein [Lentibacillus sp.]